MAALNLDNIPSNINTYERLLVWSAMCCQDIANGEQVNAVSGLAQTPLVQVQQGVTADNRPRFIVSAYLPVDVPELANPEQKLWMATEDIALAQPHVNFLGN